MKYISRQFHTVSHEHSGFVILFAVLVTTIVLAMAVGIFSIAYKETLLTSSAKESQYSFFAADSGAECGLFADLKLDAFGTTPAATIDCNGAPRAVTANGTLFVVADTDLAKGCAKVSIDKDAQVDPDGTGPLPIASYTVITSLGYNLSCAAVSSAQTTLNQRLVERRVEVSYPNPVVDQGNGNGGLLGNSGNGLNNLGSGSGSDLLDLGGIGGSKNTGGGTDTGLKTDGGSTSDGSASGGSSSANGISTGGTL